MTQATVGAAILAVTTASHRPAINYLAHQENPPAMNRYTMRGILADLANHRTVLVLAPNTRTAGNAQADLVRYLEHDPHGARDYQWNHTTGPRWVRDTVAQTSATFLSDRAEAARGCTPDVIVTLPGATIAHLLEGTRAAAETIRT